MFALLSGINPVRLEFYVSLNVQRLRVQNSRTEDAGPTRVLHPTRWLPAHGVQTRCMMCNRFSEFKTMLSSYVTEVNKGTIQPSPGLNIVDNLLNNNERFMTVFVPTNTVRNRVTAYDRERYDDLRNGVPAVLLQKVMGIESMLLWFRHSARKDDADWERRTTMEVKVSQTQEMKIFIYREG